MSLSRTNNLVDLQERSFPLSSALHAVVKILIGLLNRDWSIVIEIYDGGEKEILCGGNIAVLYFDLFYSEVDIVDYRLVYTPYLDRINAALSLSKSVTVSHDFDFEEDFMTEWDGWDVVGPHPTYQPALEGEISSLSYAYQAQ